MSLVAGLVAGCVCRSCLGANYGDPASRISWEEMIFDNFTYDFSREVLKFTISTSHFMMCSEHLTKTSINFMVCFKGDRS